MRVRFVRLLQKNINICLSKREVGCHTKRTTSMTEVYSNDAVVFEHTFQLLLKHLGYTYMQTKELADRIPIFYNTVSSLTGCKYHAGVLRCCRSARAHSRTLCLQEL